jgi:phosphopantothenoylcysteine synthetase/decarboxylase
MPRLCPNIVLAITSGIAAYKSTMTLFLIKAGFEVRVICLTAGAQAFVTH